MHREHPECEQEDGYSRACRCWEDLTDDGKQPWYRLQKTAVDRYAPIASPLGHSGLFLGED